MHHGIARILPALIIVAPGTAGGVLQETVSIAIAQLVAPAQGRFSRLQMGIEELDIAGPAPGMPEGQAVESRSIVRAIVGRGKRNPVAPRQFPTAAFVEQLAGLSVPPVIPRNCLERTQRRERRFG